MANPKPVSAVKSAVTVVPGKPASKKQLVQRLMDRTGRSKREVVDFLDAFEELLAAELGKKGPGVFSLPGVFRAKVVKKAATKARKSVNPFTKEPMVVPAKPARKVIKLLAAKALKDRLV